MTSITGDTMSDLTTILGDYAQDFNLEAIIEETEGDFDREDFWQIVEKHAIN